MYENSPRKNQLLIELQKGAIEALSHDFPRTRYVTLLSMVKDGSVVEISPNKYALNIEYLKAKRDSIDEFISSVVAL